MLQLNQQIMEEGASIFHGMNTFLFQCPDYLMLFLKDRSARVGLIRNFKFVIWSTKKEPRSVYYSGTSDWIKAFNKFKSYYFSTLNIQTLMLDIMGDEYDLSTYLERRFRLGKDGWRPGKDGLRLSQCIAGLCAAVRNTSALGLRFHHCEGQRPYLAPASVIEVPLSEVVGQFEREVWDFMAPKVLRKFKGQKHTGSALMQRRVT